MIARTDSSVLLRVPAVAAAILGSSPAWLWDIGTGRILLASAAGIPFLGAPGLAGLTDRRFERSRAPLLQIERLARTLPADGTPRLSLLRFFIGFRDVSVPCLCLRPPGVDGETVLVTAATGKTQAPLAERCAAILEDLSLPFVVSGPEGEVYRNAAARALPGGGDTTLRAIPFELAEGDFTLALPPVATEIMADEAAEGPTTESPAERDGSEDDDISRAEALSAGAKGSDAATSARALPDIRRFTFILDSEGRFSEVGAGFAALVGPKAADIIGRSWREIEETEAIDPEGRLAAALATRDTWSNVRLNWPTDFGDTVVLRLSALPRFGEGRAFAGFRGFADALAIADGRTAPAADPQPVPLPAADDAGQAEGGRVDIAAADAPEPERTARLEPGPERTIEERESAAASDEAALPGEAEEAVADIVDETKVFRLHPRRQATAESGALNDQEQTAFQAIAEALGSRWRRSDMDGQPDGAQATGASQPAVERSARGADVAPAPHDDAGAAGTAGQPVAGQAVAGLPVADRAASESILVEVLDRVPLGLAILREQRVVAANRSLLELFDYPDVESLEADGGIGALLEGRDVADAGSGAAVFARRRDGSRFAIEAKLGRTPWYDGPAMLMSVRAVPAAEEEPEAVLDAEIEEQLRESATIAVLRAVIDTALDGVMTLDEDGNILSVNAGAARLLGIDPAASEGRPFVDLFAPRDRAAVADRIDSAGSGVVPSVLQKGLEIEVPSIGREPVPVMLTIARFADDDHIRLCAVMRDLSEWKAIEADLVSARRRAEEASAQKSEFLAKMSHEIRTPLNGIIGFSEVILEERFGPLGNERYREYLKDIRQSGEHLMSLVNDLLDLSKVEAGKLELSFTGVRLGDLVEQSVAIMQPQSSRARVIIRTSLGHGLPAVVADARSIRQVLLNLLSNGIKFTPPGGQVIVSTALGETGDVFLRVRDTGPGMSEGDILIALEPFRQLSITTSTAERGTGLGLPLAKALVEANRASFAVHSKPGEGTLVEVTFPQSRVLAE